MEDGEPGFYGGDFNAYRKLSVTDERQCKGLCWFDPRCDMIAMTTYEDGSRLCRFYMEDGYMKIAETNSVSWSKKCKTSKFMGHTTWSVQMF